MSEIFLQLTGQSHHCECLHVILHLTVMSRVAASPVDEHGGRVGPGGLQVSHSVPLIDAALLRGDAALIEGHPRESNATWEVVEAP